MRPENVVVVAKREYLQRIKSKGFWIGTLVLPLFISGSIILPTLLLAKSRTSQDIIVVDETGQVAPDLAAGRVQRVKKGDFDKVANFRIRAEAPQADRKAQRAALDKQVLDGVIDAWVWIPKGTLTGEPVEYHARSVSNFVTQENLRDDISSLVRRTRLQQAGLDPERVGKLSEQVELETVKVSKEGSRAEGGLMGMLIAFGLFLMLYMSIVIWGQQVMHGVLEEKSSRVVEIVVSSIKPFELMLGKLSGICLVGLTQLTIWLTTMFLISAPGIAGSLAFLPKGGIPSISPVILVHFVLLFILGFFSFSTIYAAIGAAFNNIQEAQQVAGVAVMIVVIPFFFINQFINDPNSTLAVTLSLIPLFTPLLMSLRIALDMPPLWQLLLGYALTIGFTWMMVWACARVYRVGILMYGKKPTIQEIWKWMRYA